ncbi:MAG: DUF2182 domain-containing protein, partial [Gemmatimonadota bacterium]|nr:DUF2182 domain-containing protein [Gemmatimonadota bacterium]
VLLVTGMARRREERGAPAVHAGVFLIGYLAAWIGFSAVAALAQWLLHRAALLSPMMASASPRLSGAILVGAGLYQWLPFKHACLSHCRSPMHWLGSGWREGARGAFGMGVHHGTHCLACCWLLMALLFVAGVMNLVWVAAIAVLVLLEKVSPPGRVVARVAGVGMAAWGVGLLIGVV